MQIINNYCPICNVYQDTEFYAAEPPLVGHGIKYHYKCIRDTMEVPMGLDKVVDDEFPSEYAVFWANVRALDED